MKINKNVLIHLIITLAILAGSFYYIHQSRLRADVKIAFLAHITHSGTWTLYVNHTPLDVPVAPAENRSKPQWITFPLPKREIKTIRLTTDRPDAPPVIKAVKLKRLFLQRQWSGPLLKKIIKSLELSKGFRKAINSMSRSKTVYYLAALIAAFFVFYFIHFFNPRGLRIFFSVKIIRNMSAVFLIIIFLPAADTVINLSGKVKLHPLQEKRLLSQKPDFRFDSPSTFPGRYTRYFNDNFNFRNLLIHTNNHFKVTCFGVSLHSQGGLGPQGKRRST